METLDFQCKGFKSVTDTGSFVGYASTYGNVDLQGDVIEPGAFSAAINSQGSGFPLLWAHDPGQPIGKATIQDSRAGLICNGNLLLPDPGAERAYRFMKSDIIRGLSIGFTVTDPTAVSYDNDGVRHIKSLKLYEISCVAFPANPSAQVTSVKSLGQIEKYLRTERARVAADGAAMNDEMAIQLRAIHQHVLSLLEPVDDDGEEEVDDSLAIQLGAFADELKALVA